MADKSLDINAGGHSIKATNAESLKKLEESLADPAKFKDFANDPKKVAGAHGIHIDQAISDKLKGALAGKSSVAEFAIGDGGSPSCTVAAYAQGSFAVSSSKIAVAF